MDLELTEEQLALRATISAVLTRESPIGLARAITETQCSTSALWSTFVELGWPALTVPERAGGIGLGAVEIAVLCEELGKVIASTPLLATITQFAPLVLECGDESQQNRWLSAIAQGTCRGTGAIAEATGSFDPRLATATATATDNGYRLHGTKRYVMQADECDEIACTVKVGGAARVVIVEAHRARITPIRTLDATRSFCDVCIDDISIDSDRMLASESLDSLNDAIEVGAMALAMETVGACNSIFDITLEYAKQREQFGVPIGSFQAIKHKFADLVIALERARSLGYFASLCIAERDDRRHLAVAAAKAAAGDAQRAFAQEGIQIHGGIGYTWEHDMHLYVKRIKSNEQIFGNAATQRSKIADLLRV